MSCSVRGLEKWKVFEAAGWLGVKRSGRKGVGVSYLAPSQPQTSSYKDIFDQFIKSEVLIYCSLHTLFCDWTLWLDFDFVIGFCDWEKWSWMNQEGRNWKGRIPDRWWSMQSSILTYTGVNRKASTASGSVQRGPQFLHLQYPTMEERRRRGILG